MSESDENFDRHLRECLEPDRESVERLKASALADLAPGRRLSGGLVALSVCTTLLLALAGFWGWHSVAPPANEFTATFEGDVLIIRAADGTGWILGPTGGSQPPAGTGHVTFEGERQ
jgi:hypothetical protein